MFQGSQAAIVHVTDGSSRHTRISFSVDSSDVVFHVVHSAKHSVATFPFARHTGIVLGLVPVTVFLAGEPSFAGLCTSVSTTKERFGVPPVVLSEVAASDKGSPRGASRIGASPGPSVLVEKPIVVHVLRAR